MAIGFHQPLATNAKVVLLISQEFAQIPVKPLHLVTRTPAHRYFLLPSAHGSIAADLFLPRPWVGTLHAGTVPAIIVAFGVKVPRSARPDVLRFADALARLGYVVLWPRLRVLDRCQARIEEPTTFVTAFSFLATLPVVDRKRISYVGISVGASIALVSASNPRIARDVRSIVFFGGYFSIVDYLDSLATHRDRFEGRSVPWQPAPDAVGQVKAILRHDRGWGLLRLFQTKSSSRVSHLLAAAPRETAALGRFSPSDHLASYQAPIFILHDKGDRYVPYVESEKLYRALPRRIQRTMLLTDVFRHVEPGGGSAIQLLQLYGFVYQVFDYL